MGMLKPIVAGGAAALASEDSEAGVVLNALGKPVIEGWHGGLKGIDRFRDEFLGSGEGAHVYTHGHYIADEKKTASKYYNDRRREYSRDASYDVWNEQLIDEYLNNGLLLELKVEGAPSIHIHPDDYREIVHDSIQRYGTNVDAAKDYVTRRVISYDGGRYQQALTTLEEWKLGEWDFMDIDVWRDEAKYTLSEMKGISIYEMNRQLMYDLQDRLPPDVNVNDLNPLKRDYMLTEIVAEQLEVAAKQYKKDKELRQDIAYGTIPEEGQTRLTRDFKFKPHSYLSEKLKDVDLVDWSRASTPKKQAGFYRIHADVQLDELLHWERQLADHPEAVKMAVSAAAQDIIDKGIPAGRLTPRELVEKVPVYNEAGEAMSTWDLLSRVAKGNFPPQFSAADFATQFSQSVNPRAMMNGEELSLLLRSKGIKGMMYKDGWTRHKDQVEPSYNYVIYGDDLMTIMERGMSTVPMNMLLAMGVGTGLAAPVLDKKIAERFPMPQEEPGMMERIASNPNVQAAMKHPVTQYIGQQFDNAEWPSRMLTGVIEGIANLTQGESAADTGRQFVNRMQTPYEDTTQEVGQYVLKKTGSPAAAAVASTGMLVGDITNWIGP